MPRFKVVKVGAVVDKLKLSIALPKQMSVVVTGAHAGFAGSLHGGE